MNITDGLRLAAEFEPHRGTYVLWPVRPDNWRDGAKHAQKDIAELANTLAAYEPVVVGYNDGHQPGDGLNFHPNVSFRQMSFDDIWVRDTGPVVLIGKGRQSVAVDFRFNSWGGLFNQASADDAVGSQIAAAEQIHVVQCDLVLEGGAIVSDGAGTILVTEESVLNDNRNPGLSRANVEAIFREYLRADQIIWLPRGLAHDESGGHVDNICAFVTATSLLVADTDDARHPSFERVKEAQNVLKAARNVSGARYDLIPLVLPPPTVITSLEAAGFAPAQGTIKRSEGTPMAPSHVNFHVGNGCVVVPTFDAPTDEAAVRIVEQAYRGRTVLPFRSRELLLGGGAVHCVTRDIPQN